MIKILLCLLLAALTACSGTQTDLPSASGSYQQINQEEAKELMDSGDELIILDVREESEYIAGHIPGAVLFPVGSITESSAVEQIPDKDMILLVYCRSGNRSKTAAQTLADLGYSQVYEFGGINTWPYQITTE